MYIAAANHDDELFIAAFELEICGWEAYIRNDSFVDYYQFLDRAVLEEGVGEPYLLLPLPPMFVNSDNTTCRPKSFLICDDENCNALTHPDQASILMDTLQLNISKAVARAPFQLWVGAVSHDEDTTNSTQVLDLEICGWEHWEPVTTDPIYGDIYHN